MSNVLPLARKEARRAELERLCAAYDGEIVRDASVGQRVQVRNCPQHAQAHNGTDALTALKPTKRPRNKGMPEFEPDGQQKRFVAAMAGMRMSWDEIRLVVINPRTGRPISKETLQKAFAQELEAGKAQLKARIVAKYYAKLDDGDWNAINFGLKHICGFRDDPPSMRIGDTASNGSEYPNTSVQVEFIVPGHRRDDGPTVKGTQGTRAAGIEGARGPARACSATLGGDAAICRESEEKRTCAACA